MTEAEHQGGKARFRTSLLRVFGPAFLGLLCLLTLVQRASAQGFDPQQLFREAYEAQQRRDWALAVRKYQQLIRLRPDMMEARANLGAALDSLGRFEEAIAQYRAALALAPGNSALRLNLALAYYKKGDLARAATELRSIHQGEPANVRVATLLADCYVLLGRDGEAISLLEPLEQLNPTNPALAWVMGLALIRAGRAKEGLERIEKIVRQGSSAPAYLLAAQAHLKLGDYDQARRNLDAAVRLNPDLPGLSTLNGMILDYSGDRKGAAAAYQKALEANPRDVEAEWRLGADLYFERKLDEARLHLNRALQIDPASPAARYELARVERARGNLKAAVANLEQAARDDPDWLPPHVELAMLYYRLNRPEDGARERKIVDRLRASPQQHEPRSQLSSLPIPLR